MLKIFKKKKPKIILQCEFCEHTFKESITLVTHMIKVHQ